MPQLKGYGPDEKLLANIRSEYGEGNVLERFFANFELEPGKVLIEVSGREAPPRKPKDSNEPRVMERIYRVVAEGGLATNPKRQRGSLRLGFLQEVFITQKGSAVSVGVGTISEKTLKGSPGGKCRFIIVRRQDIFATQIAR